MLSGNRSEQVGEGAGRGRHFTLWEQDKQRCRDLVARDPPRAVCGCHSQLILRDCYSVPGSAFESASLGDLLEMQILGLSPRFTEFEIIWG